MNTWTEERVELLKQLVDQKLSASQIAARIGGISRNAVIGKSQRLGIKLQGQGPQKVLVRDSRLHRAKSVAAVNAYAQVIEFVPPPVVMPAPLNLSLMELGHRECRYPVDGEKERTLFCANATSDDSPYCTYHHKLCHGHGTHSERNVDALLRRVA